jgi:pyruvate kinase
MTGGVDLISNEEVKVTLKSLVIDAEATVANISPLTTLIYETALATTSSGELADITSTKMATATALVLPHFSFGIDAEEANLHPLTTPVTDNNMLSSMLANQALAELSKRVVGADSSDDQQLFFTALAEDLLDGKKDGKHHGSDLKSPLPAGMTAASLLAQVQLHSTAIAVEVMRHRLRISVAENSLSADFVQDKLLEVLTKMVPALNDEAALLVLENLPISPQLQQQALDSTKFSIALQEATGEASPALNALKTALSSEEIMTTVGLEAQVGSLMGTDKDSITYALNDLNAKMSSQDITEEKLTQVINSQVLPTLELTVDKTTLNETGGSISITATLSHAYVKDAIITLTYAGTAGVDTDYLAVSFPRTAEDIMRARRLLAEHGCQCGIVAKIERAEALDNLEDIIRASDVVMIARGDLGVEIGDAKLPFVQKRIIKTARTLNKVVITATQMMESMIENPIPTRAEVFDVANAVLDGSDAVMLSGETAMGKYPDKAISSMDRICREVEKDRSISTSAHRLHEEFHRVDESIAMASMYTANHLGVKVIAALTESGSTTLWMSRISSGIPIYAMTRHLRTRRKVTLYRGVYPCSFDASCFSPEEINREAVDELLRRGAVREGDLMIITNGNMSGEMGGTDTMRIIRVGESQVL